MRNLSQEETRALLESRKSGRLGCISDGEPYVVPISYLLEEGSIFSHSLPGRKIDALRKNQRACLQVDEIKDDLNWRSALAFGDFEEFSDYNERSFVLAKLLARFPMLTPVESVIAEDAGTPHSVVFRIRIDRITGVGEGRF